MKKIVTLIVAFSLIIGLLQSVAGLNSSFLQPASSNTSTIKAQTITFPNNGELIELAPAPIVTGIKYYVDATNGDNTFNGTSEQTPFKTLAKATSMITYGDGLYLKCGEVFSESLNLSNLSGQPDKVILVDQYGTGAKPIISSPGANAPVVSIFNSEGLHIRNLELISPSGNAGIQVLTLPVNSSYRGLSGFKNISIVGCYIHDINPTQVSYETGGIIFKNWAENNGDQTPTFFENILLQGNVITNVCRSGIFFTSRFINRGGINFGVNNYISDTEGWFPSKKIIIRENSVSNTAGDAIVIIGAVSPLIEKNVVTNVMGWNPIYGTANAGIWTQATNDAIIQYNEVSDTKLPSGNADGEGFDIDISCKNTIIQYNYSHDNEGGFLLMCTVAKTGTEFTTGSIIRNNLSVNDGQSFRGDVLIFGGPVKNTSIYNNTFYISGNVSKIFSNFPFGDENGVAQWADGMVFENNIVYNNGIGNDYNIGSCANFTFRNNLYWGTWKAPQGHINPIVIDPGFAHAGAAGDGLDVGLDYVPLSISTAPPAGLPIENNGGLDYLVKNTTGINYIGAILWKNWTLAARGTEYLTKSPQTLYLSGDGNYDGVNGYRFSNGVPTAGEMIYSAPNTTQFKITGCVNDGALFQFEVSSDGVNYTPVTTTNTEEIVYSNPPTNTVPKYYSGMTYLSDVIPEFCYLKIIFPGTASWGPILNGVYFQVPAKTYNEVRTPAQYISNSSPSTFNSNPWGGYNFNMGVQSGYSVYKSTMNITDFIAYTQVGNNFWGGSLQFEISSDGISYTPISASPQVTSVNRWTGWMDQVSFFGAVPVAQNIHYLKVNFPAFTNLGIPSLEQVSFKTQHIPLVYATGGFWANVIAPNDSNFYVSQSSSTGALMHLSDGNYNGDIGYRFAEGTSVSGEVVYKAPNIKQFRVIGGTMGVELDFETSKDGITFTPVDAAVIKDATPTSFFYGETLVSSILGDISYLKVKFPSGDGYGPMLFNIQYYINKPAYTNLTTSAYESATPQFVPTTGDSGVTNGAYFFSDGLANGVEGDVVYHTSSPVLDYAIDTYQQNGALRAPVVYGSTDGITYVQSMSFPENTFISGNQWLYGYAYRGSFKVSENIRYLKIHLPATGTAPFLTCPSIYGVNLNLKGFVDFGNYVIANSVISNILPGSSETDFRNANNLAVSGGYSLVFSNLTIDNKIKPGSVLKVMYNSVVEQEFIMMVYGDVTGDSNIDLSDLAAIKSHMLNVQALTGESLTAGKIYKQVAITVSDLLAVKKHLLNISLISQS